MTNQHDSDAWETVSGWLWSCRTCLAKGWAASETDAREKQAKHDAGPLPWWVARINREPADEPRCTLPNGTCYCTSRAGCLRANEDAYDVEEPA